MGRIRISETRQKTRKGREIRSVRRKRCRERVKKGQSKQRTENGKKWRATGSV